MEDIDALSVIHISGTKGKVRVSIILPLLTNVEVSISTSFDSNVRAQVQGTTQNSL